MFFKIFALVALLFFLLFGWMTLTVPMVSATAPAILMLASGGVAWLFWKQSKSRQPH
jgi:hypothetical protein